MPCSHQLLGVGASLSSVTEGSRRTHRQGHWGRSPRLCFHGRGECPVCIKGDILDTAPWCVYTPGLLGMENPPSGSPEDLKDGRMYIMKGCRPLTDAEVQLALTSFGGRYARRD